MEERERRVVENLDSASSLRQKQVDRWIRVGKASLICLESLRMSGKDCRSGGRGYRYQGIVLAHVNPPDNASGTFVAERTFKPTIKTLPSTLQARVKASPPTSSFVVHVLLLVSQNLTVPSLEQLASSNSLTGLKRTFSTACVWPFNSIWLLG